MKFQSYDKAKWHWGAENNPPDMPQEFGATHIAFFLRWCIENDFLSKEMSNEFATEIQQIKNNPLYCRDFFFIGMDGVLSSEELNTKGNLFAKAYYSGDKTKFAKAYSTYTLDYDEITANSSLDKTLENFYLYFENTEQNYQTVKKVIDKRYSEFLAF